MEIPQATGLSSLDEENTTEKRIRTLTHKGHESYETQRQYYCNKVETAWSEIQECLEKQSTCSLNLKSILDIEHSLTLCYDNYCKHSKSYLAFLHRTSTEASLRERDMYTVSTKGNKLIVENAFKQLQTSKNLAFETASRRSSVAKSHASGSSNVSSILARKRAKAEAARAKVEFAEEEAGIRKHQALLARQTADLEAELDLISCKKEAAAAKAEADVWQLEEGLQLDHEPGLDLPLQMNTLERTMQYVDQQSSVHELHKNTQIDSDSVDKHINVNVSSVNPLPHMTFHPTPKTVIPGCRVASVSADSVLEQRITHNLDANAPPFNSNTGQQPARTSEDYHPHSVTSELTRFLLKKELLLSRLTAFNDKPEMFGMWKASFQHIMNELSVTPIEEMDLLIKWLGPESSRHAQSIRASNINDPSKGIARLWERLHERYGAPELVESALSNKLREFPKLTVRDSKRLYDLSDILSEIESVKDDPKYRSLLAYYDSSSGVLPIANKLPHNIQEKWTTRAANYKKQHDVAFPPFTVFAEFIREISKIRNDPGFAYDQYVPTKKAPLSQGTYQPKKSISVKKTQISEIDSVCPVHKSNHSLNQCRGFRAKPLQQRKKFLSEQKICYRCCNSSKHVKRTCTQTVKCLVCGSDQHPAALHVNNPMDSGKQERPSSSEVHGGEKGEVTPAESVVSSKCTEICGQGFEGRSCAKIILVNVYHQTNPEKAVRTYAIIDDQSNRSLAKSDLFSKLDIYGNEIQYTLSSCAGRISTSGRTTEGCIIESLDRHTRLQLPHLIECNDIPDIKEEIPTPDVAKMYPHLRDIQEYIPPLDESEILILIGRDVIEAHHVLEQRVGPSNTPYAQRLKLGWVIVGEACLGKIHKRQTVNVNKTYLLDNGRPSLFNPCKNKIDVYETFNEIESSVFLKTANDNKPGRSVEDKEFLQLMQNELFKDDHGNWVAPLPFRRNRPLLPNNKSQAMRRAKRLDRSLSKDTTKMQHMVTFMQKVFDNHHAEPAPPTGENVEVWYLPIFGVYHPQKPGQIRAVFDSSAQYEGLSLNSVLLSGPDLTNSLLNVLIRFRTEPIAVTVDIQQMFHSFLVREDHRNYLRFLWYRNNDPTQDLVEFRMRVHVFGNRPSPAVANYGLRKTAEISEKQFGSDVKDFIENNFYVDDGLISLPTAKEAVDLIKRTQVALKKEGNLRLHKIASNSEEVMSAFPTDDLAKDLKDLNFTDDELPLQRSLGIGWNLEKDTFTFRVSAVDKPYTRRGVLSVINSIFDPIGFAGPVVIQGKLILRKCMANNSGWDDLLPVENELEWKLWKESLLFLQNIQIRRTYMNVSASLRDAVRKELHVFSDASEQAIAAVAYLKTVATNGDQHLGFVLGKAKVAPSHGHSIPRLELCGAVLAVGVYETVTEALSMKFDCVKFYTDSKVVLGYIHNQTRRFFMYVTNRVDIIRKSTSPDQWSYVATDSNPADCATRSLSARNLQDSPWLVGPTYLTQTCITPENPSVETFPLVDPTRDKELKPDVQTLKTVTSYNELGSHRFERFSSWKRLITAIALLRHVAASKGNSKQCKGWHLCSEARTVASFRDAEQYVIRLVQREAFPEECVLLNDKKALPKGSSISNLDPFIDEDGMLKVGGRLRRSNISSNEKFPLIIPKRHHIATLLVRHYHQEVFHQGRHFTEGVIRSAGYWILGGKRLVSSVIRKCVKCLKLRGKQESQKMSDLPESRLDAAPPFTYVGVDVFGPWTVVTRRTRGGQAQNKRWAVIFTCLAVRAVHIEVIEDMSSSSFISALRRFISIRGPVKQFQSDRGTNFVGATNDLGIDAVNVEDPSVKQFLFNKGTIWKFNPPHSSHMGGVWERMIGTTRKILNSMMSDIETKNLTHEVLVTFFAEVSAIINARPLVPVSTDLENPLILSPSTLLTQKSQMDVAPFKDFNTKDMYKAQWRRVQYLADVFWKRWSHEYLQTLQGRRKWQFDKPNIKCGDIVLLKQKDACRNDWPVARVESAIPGEDNRVRKVQVRVIKEGKSVFYTRPINELILLLTE